MDWAKFSIEGVTGLLELAWTRSRRPEVRRVFGLDLGEAVSTIVIAGSAALRGDALVLRFLRMVTLRITSGFQSKSGVRETAGGSLSRR